MRRLLLFVIVLLLYVSFYPWHFAYVPRHSFLEPVDLSDQKDFLLNTWVYVPMGALAYWSFPQAGALRWLIALGTGAALSLFVECVQFFLPSRVSTQSDILANVIGTLIGVLAAARMKNEGRLLRWMPVASVSTFLIVCWIGHLVLPLVPVHGIYALRANIAALRGAPFDWSEIPLWTVTWMVVWHLLPDSLPRGAPPIWIFSGLLLLMPSRLLLVDRSLSKGELIAAVLGGLLSIGLPRIAPRVLLAALLFTLALRGLTPLPFAAQAGRFVWIPFQALLSTDWSQAMVQLARKLAWYGSAVWLARRSGFNWVQAGVGVALVLSLIECAQRYIPTHVAEITDPLLALFCAVAFSLTTAEALRPAHAIPEPGPHALKGGYK